MVLGVLANFLTGLLGRFLCFSKYTNTSRYRRIRPDGHLPFPNRTDAGY